MSVAELIRATALRLKRAKLVFAHGTSDPVAEAAFLVGETLGIHPDHVDVRAGMAVTAAQEKKIAALECYKTQTFRPYANAEFVWSLARTRGAQIAQQYAEVFQLVRLVM